jgi:hypothetical protein
MSPGFVFALIVVLLSWGIVSCICVVVCLCLAVALWLLLGVMSAFCRLFLVAYGRACHCFGVSNALLRSPTRIGLFHTSTVSVRMRFLGHLSAC